MRTRPRTIEKTVLKELIFTFLLSLIAFNFILMAEKFLRLTKILASVGASLADISKIMLFIQPGLFILTTPLSFLIAVLITYGRMNMDNELIAMRAGGMSFSQISSPSLLFGSMCFTVTLLFSFYLAPMGSLQLKQTLSDIISERAVYSLEEGTFNTAFNNLVIYINKKKTKDTLEGVFMYDEKDRDRPRTLFAGSARIQPTKDFTLSFKLSDGFIHMIDNSISTEIYFDKYNFNIPLPVKEPIATRSDLTPLELLEKTSMEKGERLTKLYLEFHRRLTLPLLCLVLSFLCPPLSLLSGRSGRLGGFVIGLIVFAVYYSMLIYGENLAVGGNIPHYIGSWTPMLILIIVTFAVFRQTGKR